MPPLDIYAFEQSVLKKPRMAHLKPRKAKKGPFDPDDLVRRLKIVQYERRQIEKEETHARSFYHHVPSSAAADFETTALPEALTRVQKHTQPVVRQLGADPALAAGVTTLQTTQTLDRGVAGKTMTRNRNQFLWRSRVTASAVLNDENGVYKPSTKTFNFRPPHLRRRSREAVEEDTHSRKRQTQIEHNDRHDWTQRDEEIKKTMKNLITPFVTTKSAGWTSRTWSSKQVSVKQQQQQQQQESMSEDGSDVSMPVQGKARRASLFGRLKSRIT